jgi:hypothetical protein
VAYALSGKSLLSARIEAIQMEAIQDPVTNIQIKRSGRARMYTWRRTGGEPMVTPPAGKFQTKTRTG